MTGIVSAILSVVVLFAVLAALRSALRLRVCALCAAVSITWLALLALLYAGKNVDPLIIGIFAGGSAVGLMYFLGEKLSERFMIFRLPFLLTLFILIHIVLVGGVSGSAITVLTSLWAVFIAIYFLRHTKGLSTLSKKIIECCKNW